MCKIGSPNDFHGLGVASLIFGLLCVVLPIHGIHETISTLLEARKLTNATDVITIICGLLFSTVGICCMVLARRWMENLKVTFLMQFLFILVCVGLVLCPILFTLNVLSVFPGHVRWGQYLFINTQRLFGMDIGPWMLTDHNLMQLFLNYFLYFASNVVYRFAITAAFILISVGEFFMNIVLLVLIWKKREFNWCGYGPGSGSGLGDTSVNYGNFDENGSIVIIQPLPEKLADSKV